MTPSQTSPRNSVWLTASILVAFAAFAVSTESPLSLLLIAGYVASLVIPSRLSRDSANVWGFRLLIYAGGAILGRSLAPGSMTYYDARAFITPGVIVGGEIILQSFRVPPRGLRYDPVIILLTGLIFLIACNTYRPTLFVLAPIYVFCTLVALRDAREGQTSSPLAMWRRLAFLTFACALGAVLHLQLYVYRSNIMALGARLLSSSQATAQGDTINDSPQLTSSFGANMSTNRLIRITGKLSSPNLRLAAFDSYRVGSWGPALSTRTAQIVSTLPQETLENDPKDPTEFRKDTDATLTVLRETGGNVFVPLNIYAFVPGPGGSFDWKRYDGPVRTDDNPPITYSVINSKQELDGYGVTQGPMCLPPDAKTTKNEHPDGHERRQLLDVPPEIDPRVRQLALSITRGATTDFLKVDKVVKYLLQNHQYSFEFVRTSQDPVSDFLLNKKPGHCQYFASAATILMRCVGVPARYVSGYHAHEQNSDGSFIVRGRDAHAWTEAFVTWKTFGPYRRQPTDKRDTIGWHRVSGWISVDATVPIGRADPNVNPLPAYQHFTEWVQDTFIKVRDWFGRLTAPQIAAIIGTVLLIWGLERWRQTYKKRHRQPQALPLPAELMPLALRFERVLNRRGITLLPERPWSESLPDELRAEARWVDLYNRIRFSQESGGRLDEPHLNELRQQLESLEKAKVTAPAQGVSEADTDPPPEPGHSSPSRPSLSGDPPN